MFDDPVFSRRLQRFGIRGLDPGEGPSKDTETKFRYKFGVIVGGGVRYPTKVEVSFRQRHAEDRELLEAPDPRILRMYNLDALEVRHYVREAAVRQKIEALGGRREAQARDAFDLNVLVPDVPAEALLEFLAKALSHNRLKEAYNGRWRSAMKSMRVRYLSSSERKRGPGSARKTPGTKCSSGSLR